MSADDILFAPIGVADIKLPDSWIEVINRIRTEPQWSKATLAGGALRDMDNGRPVKDVDIFIPYIFDNDVVGNRLGLCLPNNSITEVEHDAHSTSQVGVVGISHFLFEKDGWNFEISQSTLPGFDYLELLNGFDIGLCMIALDQSNKIYRSPEYKLDVANKSITIVRETGGREVEHAERLARKYSRWTIVMLP